MVAAMIRLSADIIWSSQLLLKRLTQFNLRNVDELYVLSSSSANLDLLVELATKCCWITINDSSLIVNERGYELAAYHDFESLAQAILMDYIIKVSPVWSKRIPYGRREAFIFMSKDEKACFFEAGLMHDDPDNMEIKWWDRMANYIRSQNDLEKNQTGRKGEFCTILYEKNRVGEKPQWVSIDSNLVGYDIISCVSRENQSKLLIEVKSTEMSIDNAEFYISVHEWHTACNSSNYSFYLWCFYQNRKKLAVVEPVSILPYIPTNNETGEWQTVRIPYKSFQKMFTEIA